MYRIASSGEKRFDKTVGLDCSAWCVAPNLRKRPDGGQIVGRLIVAAVHTSAIQARTTKIGQVPTT
jgi:hypothetical protein